MKTFFAGHGSREIKRWDCPHCGFCSIGMDLYVDQSVCTHKAECPHVYVPKKVYLVQEGCRYNGVGVVSVHETEDGAIKAAEQVVKESRMRTYSVAVAEGSDLHMWADDSDILVITEHEVKG